MPFTADFESGGHEADRWDEGVDTLAQIKRLVTDIDSPYLGVCVAPPHLWVEQETIGDVVRFLMERKKLFHYYVWDIDHAYKRGEDGLDFGPGEEQLPRPDGVLDWKVLLHDLAASGYEGVASLKCHGTAGWPLDYVSEQVARLCRVHPQLSTAVGLMVGIVGPRWGSTTGRPSRLGVGSGRRTGSS